MNEKKDKQMFYLLAIPALVFCYLTMFQKIYRKFYLRNKKNYLYRMNLYPQKAYYSNNKKV